MNKIIYIFSFAFLAFFTNTNVQAQSYDIKFIGPGLIKIHGSSNVNRFMLAYNKPVSNPRQITIGKAESNRRSITGNNKIALEVGAFNSSNKMITSDFKKMLKQDKFPTIGIEISRLINNPVDPMNPSVMAVLTIAGTKRLEILPVVLVNRPNNQIQMTAMHRISLKNYKLEPPKKIMGMVAVSDEVFIEITLIAQYKAR